MAVFPKFQMPDDVMKLRFQEPYVSEGTNLKTSGIVPPGIYQGFIPSTPAIANTLLIDPDPGPVRDDSVAVVDVKDPSAIRPIFNTTIRTRDQITLDFTGHAPLDLPVDVVIRADYQITANPFSGLSDVKILTVDPLLPVGSAENAPHEGDVIITTVTALGTPLTIDNTKRQITSVGGGLTHAEVIDTSGNLLPGGSVAFIPTGVPVLAFTLTKAQSVMLGVECVMTGVTGFFDTLVIGLSVDGGPVSTVTQAGPRPTGASAGIASMTGCRAVALGVGAHTVELYYRVPGGAGPATPYLNNNTNGPTRLTAVYST